MRPKFQEFCGQSLLIFPSYEQPTSLSSPAASTHPMLGATLTSSDVDGNIMSKDRREVASIPCRDPNGVVSLESGSVTVSTSSRSCDWGNFITLSSESRCKRRRYRSGNSNQPQTETITQVFKVIPWFLSKSIQLVCNRLEDHSLSIALRVRHVLPDKDCDEVITVIARDDVSGLQNLISGGVCAKNSLAFYYPIVVVRFTSPSLSRPFCHLISMIVDTDKLSPL